MIKFLFTFSSYVIFLDFDHSQLDHPVAQNVSVNLDDPVTEIMQPKGLKGKSPEPPLLHIRACLKGETCFRHTYLLILFQTNNTFSIIQLLILCV